MYKKLNLSIIQTIQQLLKKYIFSVCEFKCKQLSSAAHKTHKQLDSSQNTTAVTFLKITKKTQKYSKRFQQQYKAYN